jgi:hypothetical protein
MPDFFRGKGWETDNIPPKEGRPAMQVYIQSIGSWELVRPDLLATIEYLEKEGKTSIGVCREISPHARSESETDWSEWREYDLIIN